MSIARSWAGENASRSHIDCARPPFYSASYRLPADAEYRSLPWPLASVDLRRLA